MSERAAGISDDLDPDVRAFAEELNRSYSAYPHLDEMPLTVRRDIAEKVRAPWAAGGPEMHSVTDVYVDGVQIRLNLPKDPKDGPLPCMLYVHGGGWTMFSIDTHDRLMREYAARAGIAVAGVEYSLSPEAKFPTALEEIVIAHRWLREHGSGYGIDASRLAIGGDSAGANLAVTANLKMRDNGDELSSAMLLNYGAFGHAPTPSYDRYGGADYTLTVDEMGVFWDNYTRDAADLDDPLAVPIEADLTGLPPAFFAIAECDILADGNRLMAERLQQAGVETEAHVYRGATHSFLEAVSVSPLAERAFDDSAGWLRTRLGLA